jgi:hypothetical protein
MGTFIQPKTAVPAAGKRPRLAVWVRALSWLFFMVLAASVVAWLGIFALVPIWGSDVAFTLGTLAIWGVVIELPLGVMYMIVLVMFMVSSQSTRRQKLISGLVVSGLSIILFYLAPVFVLLMGGHP